MLRIWLISWMMFPRSLRLIGGVRLHITTNMMPFPTPTLMRRKMYEVTSQQAADDALQDWELLGPRLSNNDSARDENPDDIGNIIRTSIACTIGRSMSIATRILPPITGMG
jgi:hypothetical protein